MSTLKNGGCAFPVKGYDHGMTLRDYIAIHASDEDVASYIPVPNPKSGAYYVSRQTARYRFADAMLSARGES